MKYGLTSIGIKAFIGDFSLLSISIPDSVTDIGVEAFAGCPNLTKVDVGRSVSSIGNWAFPQISPFIQAGTATFWGKKRYELSTMPNYPWGLT
jgi:hypothetical protein